MKREWRFAGLSADTRNSSHARCRRSTDDRRRPRAAGALPSSSPPSSLPKQATESGRVSQDINVLALVKGEERYVFLYDDDNRAETLRMLGRYASNPELSFTWYDAAVLSQKIRATAQQVELEERAAHNDRFTLPLPSDLHRDDDVA
jgi:hypothetical protein